jgi:hypothetical protein
MTMSSMAALLLALTATAGPMPDGTVVGQPTALADGPCPAPVDPRAITVCGHRSGPSPRLPLPDDRLAPGEEVRLAGEVRQDPGPPGEPGRLGDTLVHLFKAAKSAVTGADPGY